MPLFYTGVGKERQDIGGYADNRNQISAYDNNSTSGFCLARTTTSPPRASCKLTCRRLSEPSGETRNRSTRGAVNMSGPRLSSGPTMRVEVVAVTANSLRLSLGELWLPNHNKCPARESRWHRSLNSATAEPWLQGKGEKERLTAGGWWIHVCTFVKLLGPDPKRSFYIPRWMPHII